MLSLTRCIGETLCIGDDVKIVISAVKGDQVRLGISAPRHVPVHRQEIHEKIQRSGARETQRNAARR